MSRVMKKQTFTPTTKETVACTQCGNSFVCSEESNGGFKIFSGFIDKQKMHAFLMKKLKKSSVAILDY